MPFFVMNYNIEKRRIVYANDFVKDTLSPTKLDWDSLYTILSCRQEIKYQSVMSAS